MVFWSPFRVHRWGLSFYLYRQYIFIHNKFEVKSYNIRTSPRFILFFLVMRLSE